MPRMKIASALVLALALVVAPSCGGGGHGFRVNAAPLQITTQILPLLLSGDVVDIEIELTGGCNGPYVVSVISGGVNGGMPDGVGVENRLTPNAGPDGIIGTADDGDGPDGVNGTADDGMRFGAFITGILLEEGTFQFTVQVTDSNCAPFLSVTQDYTWNVGRGQVRIVAADPALIAEADFIDLNKHEAATNPSTTEPIDALPTTVYNQFVAIDFIVAGGEAPYEIRVIDDPNDPDDRDLPLGVVIPVDSRSIVGAPVQVLPGGVPFLITIEVEDNAGNTSTKKVQWKIDTPPIIVATTTLPDGKAGTPYGEPIQTADGVPPFSHELINTAGEPDFEQHVYASPAVPTFPTTPGVTVNVTGDSNNQVAPGDYPTAADTGPYTSGTPSEGMYLVDFGASSGQMTGVPRRVGNFDVFFHVYSQLVPNERGQHGFGNFNFDIAPSEPPVGLDPAFGVDGTFTTEGTLIAAAPHSTFPEFSVDVPYNPDGGQPGLQLLAQGGVPFDGFTDGPHASQRFANGEPTSGTMGFYRWAIDDWHPGTAVPDPASIDLLFNPVLGTSTGILYTPDETLLQRSSARKVDIALADEQLPTSLQNTLIQRFNYSVGPDLVIITESTSSVTANFTRSSGEFFMMDATKRVKKFENKNGTGTVAVLDSGDLATTTVIPAPAVSGVVLSNTALDDLLSDFDVDLVRLTVNPATYMDDLHSLHPGAARPGQHADHNAAWHRYNQSYRFSGQMQSNVAAVNLPDVTNIGVTHDPDTGVYTTGGKMHCFETSTHMGLFIIRSDSKIYVPYATRKGTGTFAANSFGDNWHAPRADEENSLLRTTQIAVSPDGRYGVAEIQAASAGSSQHRNTAANSRLVVFSLSGEKLFNGGTETYTIINPIPTTGGISAIGPGSDSPYLYASSIVATNEYVYFLIGTYDNQHASWRDHYVLRVKLDGTEGNAALVPGLPQGANNPCQTPFHQWDFTVTSGISQFSSSGTTFITGTDDDTFLYDGTNWLENSMAPIPFRVSENGRACAILAGARSTSTSSSPTATDVMQHHLYVAYDDNPARQASTASQVHYVPTGASRGSALGRGPNSYRHWWRYTGPSTTLEISRDGMRAAFVGFGGSDSISSTSSAEGKWLSNTCDVFAFSASGGAADPWLTVALPPSSTNGNLTSNVFLGSHNWRFGSLGFTADNDALFFWAGCSEQNMTSTSSSSVLSYYMEGSYYIFDFNAGAKTLKSMLSRSDGGSTDGIQTYNTTTNTVTFASTTAWSGVTGYIMPNGGFFSKNGDFFYVVDHSPHDSTSKPSSLLGFNVSAYTGNTINGKAAGQGFEVDSFAQNRPFLSHYHYWPHYAFDIAYYNPKGAQGMGKQVVAKDTGWVFWATQYAGSGPTSTTTTTFGTASGPALGTNWSGVDRGGEVWGFNPNVAGPATELTHPGLGGDSSTRAIHFLDVNDAGTNISFVYDDQSSYPRLDYERVGYIYGVAFDAVTGDIDPSYDETVQSRVLESSRGRAGEGMAHDSTGTRVYYAFKTGTGGNERDKGIVEATRDPTTGVITLTRFFTSSADDRWFDILNAGR